MVELMYNLRHFISLWFRGMGTTAVFWGVVFLLLFFFLHGIIVICFGIDVNSLSSARLGGACATCGSGLARDTSQSSDKPKCKKRKEFKYERIFEF